MQKEINAYFMKDAVKEAMEPVVELQRIALKPVLSPKEVEKLYGISTQRLEVMRAESRGPAYVQLCARGSVMYTRKDVETWLSKNVITPKSV